MSCPHCPHCIASGAFGVIDDNDPALTGNLPGAATIHKSTNSQMATCGVYAFLYKDKRTGSSAKDWKDVTCRRCLAKCPPASRLATIAALCVRCANGENVFRGQRDWVHGNLRHVRCDASDLRDLHYGAARRSTRPPDKK